LVSYSLLTSKEVLVPLLHCVKNARKQKKKKLTKVNENDTGNITVDLPIYSLDANNSGVLKRLRLDPLVIGKSAVIFFIVFI
jgi:hypothetical protein